MEGEGDVRAGGGVGWVCGEGDEEAAWEAFGMSNTLCDRAAVCFVANDVQDFLDSIESLLPGHPQPTTIASRPTFSRKAARNMFSQYDAKEIRRGIDTLRKRIEKHFGDADEEVLSRNLVGFVCKECERAYERTINRMERIVSQVYPVTEGEKSVEVDFSREDVRAGFRR